MKKQLMFIKSKRKLSRRLGAVIFGMVAVFAILYLNIYVLFNNRSYEGESLLPLSLQPGTLHAQEAAREIYLPIIQNESDGISLPPISDDFSIVFVSRQIPENGSIFYEDSGSMPGVGPYSRFQLAAPGKLLVREADGKIRTLIDGSAPTQASLNLIDVNAPDVSYDGTKIVFAGLPNGDYPTGNLKNPGGWRIYSINVDGTGLEQITFSDRDIDLSQFPSSLASTFEKYDDTDPVWLPDGRIVFSSTRWPSYGMYGGARTSNLYVVEANGDNIHRITAEKNGADRPLVDPLTGKIVYSRWWRNYRVATNNMSTIEHPDQGYIMRDGLIFADYVQRYDGATEARLNRNFWQLSTVNPDGTGLAQWAGESNTYYTGEDNNHAYGGGFSPYGVLYANYFPTANGTEAAGFGGIRSYERGPNGYESIIGITFRDESVLEFVNSSPPSFGVYKGNYATEPEVLPDGRIIISWAENAEQDYDLYVVNSDGTNLQLLYENKDTTELRARVIRPRNLPPIIPDQVTEIASELPPLEDGPYNIDGTFTFEALNVYANAPIDTNIVSAIPVGSAGTIRFFIDHQRTQQVGSFGNLDWPILLNEVQINPDGSVVIQSPANVPLFEQIRSPLPEYTVPLTGDSMIPNTKGGAAHVAGLNFGRTGEVATCVGCHAGHTMIEVPENPEDALWSNLAPGATVTSSSQGPGLQDSDGLVDRRVNFELPKNNFVKYWFSDSSQDPEDQWVELTFLVPISIRVVRLYNLPGSEYDVQVNNATVILYSDAAGTNEIARKSSGFVADDGTDVQFDEVKARVIRIEFDSVNGDIAGLAEVEVIARGEAGP